MSTISSPANSPTTSTFTLLLSGLSSSGKTTITNHLRNLLCPDNTIILHEDDFFYPDSKIPLTDHGVQNWDCPEAIDWVEFLRVLRFVKVAGRMPVGFRSVIEGAEEVVEKDEEEKGDNGDNGDGKKKEKEGLVRREILEELRSLLEKEGLMGEKIVIVEGFLMFQKDSVVDKEADAKILLRVDRETAKKRREKRGYLTIEGYWQDPPGYFDDIVWPNYVKAHEHLFENGQVEQELNEEARTERRIHMPPPGNMEETLRWAVEVLVEEYKRWEKRTGPKSEL
ncbi:P-loop containing nucleoside triphosphate hydrolase protein [Pyronema omphalodes]|nr:P-loop containing nucleoside triphosphate hydrolase protein [Pyronema omphalodes]